MKHFVLFSLFFVLFSCFQEDEITDLSVEDQQSDDISLAVEEGYATSATSGTCNCNTYNGSPPVQYGSYWTGYDVFNCHQYVKAYFHGGRMDNEWIPPKYNSPFDGNKHPADFPSSQIFYDPAFTEVTDPDQAHAVYWPNDHSAIIINGNCLISKSGFYGNLYTHGINGGEGGGTPRFFRFNNRSHFRGVDNSCLDGGGDPDPTCATSSTISGTYSDGNGSNKTLYTFHNVPSGSVSINASASGAERLRWTRTGGSASYYTSSDGTYCGFSLYSGSVSFQIDAINECDDVIATKSVIFQVSGSNPW